MPRRTKKGADALTLYLPFRGIYYFLVPLNERHLSNPYSYEGVFNHSFGRKMNCVLLVTFAAVILAAGCSKFVRDEYPARSDAQNDRLFERGWLPEIIPQSSNRIVTKNDLDLNRSSGEFYFDESDLTEFLSHLTRKTSEDENEYVAYSYSKGIGEWIFLVDESRRHCRYRFEQ